MTLPFSTHWEKNMPEHMAGKPTRFTEKIWQSFDDEFTLDHFTEYDSVFDFIGYSWSVDAIGMHPKKHTIRRDEKNRWKAGNDIHFTINVRTKDQFQFAPVVKCVSTQRIDIKHRVGYIQVNIDDECFGEVFHHGLDDIYEYTDDLLDLVKNDGFDTLEDFFAWFNTDFTGKIIHWTNLKY